MYKLCKTEQSTRRQREIERELLALMKQKKFDSITVTELSEKMNIPRKAFYRYFDSKEDALNALIDHTMAEYSEFSVDRSGETNRSLVRELDEYFKFWIEQSDLLRAVDKSGLIGTLIERTVNFPVGDRILISKFLPKEDIKSTQMIFKFAFTGLTYTMIEWYRTGFATPTRDMAKQAVRMLCQPLFPYLNQIGIS